MFGMSGTELIIILVLALVLIGPDDLPDAAKKVGKALRDVRRASDDLRDTFEREVMSEVKQVTAPPPGVIPKAPPAHTAPLVPPQAALPPAPEQSAPVATGPATDAPPAPNQPPVEAPKKAGSV
jgi:sec-independent protein translocase protein TatB